MAEFNGTTGHRTYTRRQAVELGAGVTAAAAALIAVTGCEPSSSSSSSGSSSSQASSGASSSSEASSTIDTAAFDALVAGGTVADNAVVEANSWAKAVKDAGKLRVGGVQTSILFSQLDEKDGKMRGFDAGLFELLARYITGSESNYELTQVTSDTRESVLQNDQVDTVFATYSITAKRKEIISFAGPYYTSQQGILVAANNTTINGVDDLDGKNVAAQSGSTGPSILEQYAPNAKIQEFTTDQEARNALEQGRVDAYVIDQTMQMGSIVRNPGKYKLVGEPFGPEDNYGIGMKLNSEGVSFVNDFLKAIEADGTWAQLWEICIGQRTDVDTVPTPPAIA